MRLVARSATRDFGRATFFAAGEKSARLFFAVLGAKKIGARFFYFAGVVFFKSIFVHMLCVTWKRHERLGIGNVTNHRLWRMANIVVICFSLLSIDLGAAMLAPSYS